MAKTLQQLRDKIEDEVAWVDIKPYSHNLIGLYLQQIDKDYGKDEANSAIIDYGLTGLGWSVRE